MQQADVGQGRRPSSAVHVQPMKERGPAWAASPAGGVAAAVSEHLGHSGTSAEQAGSRPLTSRSAAQHSEQVCLVFVVAVHASLLANCYHA